jgi:hypothetical protein
VAKQLTFRGPPPEFRPARAQKGFRPYHGGLQIEAKTVEVLCVYREVELLKQSEGEQAGQAPAVATVSYDEKPGV